MFTDMINSAAFYPEVLIGLLSWILTHLTRERQRMHMFVSNYDG